LAFGFPFCPEQGKPRAAPLAEPYRFPAAGAGKTKGYAAAAGKRKRKRKRNTHDCSEKGTPITVPWLSGFEANVRIEPFNSIIRGLAEYYLPLIRNKSKLQRWIYILRFSCLKTLAQK
jgi:hypothetical protein